MLTVRKNLKLYFYVRKLRTERGKLGIQDIFCWKPGLHCQGD